MFFCPPLLPSLEESHALLLVDATQLDDFQRTAPVLLPYPGTMTMASTSPHPGMLGMGCGRVTTQNDTQFFIEHDSRDPGRDDRADGEATENTGDEGATDSGSGSDSGEETIISEEVQEDSVQQPNGADSKPDACAPGQLPRIRRR